MQGTSWQNSAKKCLPYAWAQHGQSFEKQAVSAA